ncbi:MAG: ATPase [Longimicrobiales bacterium]
MATYEKGFELLRACRAEGARVLLLTTEKLRDAAWPRDVIDEVYVMPDLYDATAVVNAVSYLARTEPIDRISPLDEFDMEMAATLREHLRMYGMGETAVRFFRDKLAMRKRARATGMRVPEFTALHHHPAVESFFDRVSGPWILKPRTQASAIGLKKFEEREALWPLLEALGDKQSHHLLEQFVPGDVFHVDSIVANGVVVFAEVHRYGETPFRVMHGGGIFSTATVDRASPESRALRAMNEDVARGLGMTSGVMHTEFIRAHEDREFYFLETAARVGGAYIAETVEAATGVNLWREWARVEIAAAKGEQYELPVARQGYAGVLLSLARQAAPDTSAYDDMEIVMRVKKDHHAGLIVAADDPTRVTALLQSYMERFHTDFYASMPAPDKATN